VEGDKLGSEKVSEVYGQILRGCPLEIRYLLSTGDARRQHKVYQTLVVVQSRNRPLAIRVHAILIDFEPFEARDLGAQSIIDFGEVHHDRA
jgi:hypothetical protein